MNKRVYHGSSNGNIEVLASHKSTHQKKCIYASSNKVVALLFMGKGNRDLDTRISSVNGKPELVERRKGVLETLYQKEGYLYELDGTTFAHYDYLWSLEVISFENELTENHASRCENIPENFAVTFQNVSVAYGNHQVLKGVSFTASPGECIGIIGESGSGKSTLVKALMQMIDYQGEIYKSSHIYF